MLADLDLLPDFDMLADLDLLPDFDMLADLDPLFEFDSLAEFELLPDPALGPIRLGAMRSSSRSNLKRFVI